MRAISTKRSKTRKLNIAENFLTSINLTLLAVALNTLEEAVLYFTFLSEEQARAVLSQSLVGTRLKRLKFGPVGDLEVDKVGDLEVDKTGDLGVEVVDKARQVISVVHFLKLGSWARKTE